MNKQWVDSIEAERTFHVVRGELNITPHYEDVFSLWSPRDDPLPDLRVHYFTEYEFSGLLNRQPKLGSKILIAADGYPEVEWFVYQTGSTIRARSVAPATMVIA